MTNEQLNLSDNLEKDEEKAKIIAKLYSDNLLPPFGMLADILHRSYTTYINRNFREEGLNYSHVPLLVAIYLNSDISQEKIAKNLKIDKGSVAKGFRKLEEKGYLVRNRDENDRRKYNIVLTESGKEIIEKAAKVNNVWESTVLKDFDSEEFKIELEKVTNYASDLIK